MKLLVADCHVKKQFKYAGKEYRQGDMWHPTGSPNDAKMAKSPNLHLIFKVVDIPDAPVKKAPARRKRRTT